MTEEPRERSQLPQRIRFVMIAHHHGWDEERFCISRMEAKQSMRELPGPDAARIAQVLG